jgi:hypothetical protein
MHTTLQGNTFVLSADAAATKDPRGTQPGDVSEGLGMQELRIHVQHGTNLAGIARFYSELMGAHVSYSEGDTAVTVATSPLQQRLVFEAQPEGAAVGQYSGYHVSIYIQDLESTFKVCMQIAIRYCY